MKRTILSALFFAAAFRLAAQQAPEVARGFDAEKVYAAGPIDNVNIFNGNLIATIPLGQTYVVSPALSYSFKAIHNGKTWDYVQRHFTVDGPCRSADDLCQQPWTEWDAIPDGTANAGFGWRVQFARFITGGALQANLGPPLFEGPDGASHAMYPTLHDAGPPYPTDSPAFSRDGTYLRWHGSTLDTPEGITYEFDSIHGLTQMHDQVKDASGNYVNRVDIEYGPAAGEPAWPCEFPALSWKVTDTQSRTHYVCFKNMNYDGTMRATVTDVYVESPAGRAHYLFHHDLKIFGRENAEQMHRQSPTPTSVTVPALTSITLPDNSSYSFQYMGTAEHPGVGTGNFYSMTLPTKGTYRYSFDRVQIPGTNECILYENWLGTYTGGVYKREELDADGTVTGQTIYARDLSRGEGFYDCTTDQEGPGYFTAFSPGAELAVSVIPADNHSKTVHYFSVWPGYNRTYGDSPDGGFKRIEYGLPLSHRESRGGLWLSTATYTCTDAYQAQCDASRVAATYVAYDVDERDDHLERPTSDRNARLAKSLTVFFADGEKTSTVTNSDFDGFGHYRVTETTGFGSSITRRTTTDFNAAGTMPATTNPWLLNLFTYRKTEDLAENGAVVSAARTDVCFDTATGFLKRRRVYAAGTTPSPTDLLAVFANDGYGNVASESYYGGDRVSLAGGFDTCNASVGTPQYRISHSYASGVMTRSQYDGTTFNSYDVTVDTSGAITKSRDTAGSETTYAYDLLGRLTALHPPGSAWTEYEYTLPTTSTGRPAVAVRQRAHDASPTAAALTEQRFYFDGLGRLIQRKSSMPSNKWATMQRTYDVMGRVQREYVPYETSAPDFDTTPATGNSTQYTYGDWARVTSDAPLMRRTNTVTLPDGSQTSTVYTGSSAQDVTSSVATAVNQQTARTKNYGYDYLGRLTSVAETAGSGTITASYGYDIGDRLTSVQMTASPAAQSRTFVYDGRGFLTSETHPENGTTTYQQYDARGHAWEKRVNGDASFDLNLTFDSAERLTEVDARNPNYSLDPAHQTAWRILKVFNFATANSGSNYARGRLSSAARHNNRPIGDILINESFEYDQAGRQSKKTTTVAEHTSVNDRSIQTFEQNFSYDELGNLVRAGYPSCTDPNKLCGGSPLQPFDYGYDHGYLASVPGFIDTISYYPTGVVKQVDHSNGLKTEQAQDDSGMARIKSIKVANYGNCAVVPAISAQPADTNVNSGSTASFSVSATGNSLTYQWFNATTGQAVAGATTSSYTTAALTQDASYYVVVSSPCGAVQSRTAAVTVCTAPAIDIQPADTGTNSSGTATLTVHATGGPLRYQWYDGNGQPVGGATSASFTTPVVTQTAVYYVIVSTPCGSAVQSRTATVSACTTPSLAPQPSNTVAVSGGTATLTASATGTPLHYHWYAGFSGDTSQPVGTDSASYTTPAVTAVARYWVQVTNACGSVNGATLSVTPLDAPPSVTATYYDGTHVNVAWPAAANAQQYRILRREAGTALRAVATVASSVTSLLDAVPTNAAYLYCVQALDSAGTATPCSAADVGSTRSFSAIVVGQPVYAVHAQQILDGINAVYDVVGAAHVSWGSILPANIPAPATNVGIFAQQLTSLRNAVAAARATAAQSSGVTIAAVNYTDPQPAGLGIKAVHFQELQAGLK